MSKIGFFPWLTDDAWVRDNEPIFVFDEDDGSLCHQLGVQWMGRKGRFSILTITFHLE
jgi:hypothetical protein